jgi:MFS superfamily sulfate permease-like transporter
MRPPNLEYRFESRCNPVMKRFAGLCLAAWSAAALLYFGRHSAALIVLSGVLMLAGFDLFRPESGQNP